MTYGSDVFLGYVPATDAMIVMRGELYTIADLLELFVREGKTERYANDGANGVKWEK